MAIQGYLDIQASLLKVKKKQEGVGVGEALKGIWCLTLKECITVKVCFCVSELVNLAFSIGRFCPHLEQ